eukprot:2746001-Amphidinium_carterae.1
MRDGPRVSSISCNAELEKICANPLDIKMVLPFVSSGFVTSNVHSDSDCGTLFRGWTARLESKDFPSPRFSLAYGETLKVDIERLPSTADAALDTSLLA